MATHGEGPALATDRISRSDVFVFERMRSTLRALRWHVYDQAGSPVLWVQAFHRLTALLLVAVAAIVTWLAVLAVFAYLSFAIQPDVWAQVIVAAAAPASVLSGLLVGCLLTPMRAAAIARTEKEERPAMTLQEVGRPWCRRRWLLADSAGSTLAAISRTGEPHAPGERWDCAGPTGGLICVARRARKPRWSLDVGGLTITVLTWCGFTLSDPDTGAVLGRVEPEAAARSLHVLDMRPDLWGRIDRRVAIALAVLLVSRWR